MTPPVPLPPPPPAIHAPVPQVQTPVTNPVHSSAQQVLQMLRPYGGSPLLQSGGRWLHVKHWKGRKHSSHASRSAKRKAARKAKNRR